MLHTANSAAPPRRAIRALLTALDRAQALVALYDARDVLIAWNDAFERHFLRGAKHPITFPDIIRHGFKHQFGVKIDSGDVERFLEGVLMRRRATRERTMQTDLVDGTWLWLTETVLEDGWFLTLAHEITALKNSERGLAHARDAALREAQTDPLTGLPNRRGMLDWHARHSSDVRLAVTILDLDYFKAVNDRFGHDGGDAVLRHFGAIASARLGGGLFGRLGGEEFFWLVPAREIDPVLLALDALRADGPAIPTHEANFAVRVTFSAGTALSAPGENLTDVLRRADSALYAAKMRGRDRVVIAADP
jgi:diguanylate cyclase (GGDEF)-like protein